MPKLEEIDEVEDLRRTVSAIRLTCERYVDEILCDEGVDLKREVIGNIDFLGVRNPVKMDVIDLEELVTKARMWDRALELGNDCYTELMKEMTEEIDALIKQITVLKQKEKA